MRKAIVTIGAAALLLTGCATGDTGVSSAAGGGGDKGSEGGSWLTRAASAGCTNPLIATYECFEGQFIETVAAESAYVNPNPAPLSFTDRPPRTLSFSGRLQADGTRASAPFPAAGQIVYAPALKAHAEQVLGQLLAHAPTPPPQDISVHVIANPFFGGSATSENDIFIHLGTFNEIQNDGPLAALLAHEAAHILLNHFDREELINRQQQVTGFVSRAAVVAAGFSSQKFGKRPDGSTGFFTDPGKTEDAKKTATTAMAVNYGVNFFTTDVIGGAWSRRQEDEADLLGNDLLVKAGYNPRATVQALRILKKMDAGRQLELEKLDADTSTLESAFQNGLSTEGIIAGLTDMAAQVFEAGWNDIRSYTQRAHRDPEKREEDMREYIKREHAQAGGAADGSALDAAKRKANFPKLWERYSKVNAARAMLLVKPVDLPKAEATLRDGMGGSVAQDPFPRELLASILDQQGKTQEALASYGRIRPGGVLSLSGYIEKIDIELRLGREADARRTLQTAQGVYGKEAFYHVELRILAAEGDAEGVKRVAKTCEDSERADVQELCKTTLAGIPASLGGSQGQPEEPGLLGVLTGAGTGAPVGSDAASAGATSGAATGGTSTGGASGGVLGAVGSLFSN